MNYTDQQIEEGLKNFFIQVKVTSAKGEKIITEIAKRNGQPEFKFYDGLFIYGQIFNDGNFGLNGRYFKQNNLTIISI